MPDPQLDKGQRRRFTAEQKRRILDEVDACTERGQVASILRRDGLYASQLSNWRRQREEQGLAGLEPKAPGRSPPRPLWRSSLAPPLMAFAVVALLGFATAGVTRQVLQGGPETIAGTRVETEALARDFANFVGQRCSIHKRVYTFVEQYDEHRLLEGEFAALTGQGLAPERAAFFLDPWNSPYWIRYKCDREAGVRRAFVYSFGPNRQRDSSTWEIRGDDVGTVFAAVGGLAEAGGDEAGDPQ